MSDVLFTGTIHVMCTVSHRITTWVITTVLPMEQRFALLVGKELTVINKVSITVLSDLFNRIIKLNAHYVCMNVCMYVCTYVRTYVRIYVCMYVCMYV